jgi:DNA-binding NtrC family response regulator
MDSAEAAILIKKNKYDGCLFDYKMEGLSGLDLLKITKKVNSQCPVFIISGALKIDEIFKKAKDAGSVAGVISKPFDVEALLQEISAIVK